MYICVYAYLHNRYSVFAYRRARAYARTSRRRANVRVRPDTSWYMHVLREHTYLHSIRCCCCYVHWIKTNK